MLRWIVGGLIAFAVLFCLYSIIWVAGDSDERAGYK